MSCDSSHLFSVRAFDNGVIHLDCGNVFSDGQPISSKFQSSKPIVNVVKVRIKIRIISAVRPEAQWRWRCIAQSDEFQLNVTKGLPKEKRCSLLWLAQGRQGEAVQGLLVLVNCGAFLRAVIQPATVYWTETKAIFLCWIFYIFNSEANKSYQEYFLLLTFLRP